MQPTIIYDKPLWCVADSKRLGHALGINLMPETTKLCAYDCLYCDCKKNKRVELKPVLPSRKEVFERLEAWAFWAKQRSLALDTITFTGNGEPTGHPEFESIVDDVLMIRRYFYPKSKVAVLTTGAHLHRPDVQKALDKVDFTYVKLDAGCDELVELINRPHNGSKLKRLVDLLKNHKSTLVVQTCFMKGLWRGRLIDNTQTQALMRWCDCMKEMHPSWIEIFSIDPKKTSPLLRPISLKELERLSRIIHQHTHLPVEVVHA